MILPRPLSVEQSNRLLGFLEVVLHFGLISDDTFQGVAYRFDDWVYDTYQLSWEPPPPEWFQEDV